MPSNTKSNTNTLSAYDAVIVGGGPAGLSAALILGRCRRRVLVCDLGKPRNFASHALHGFLSRDGIEPAELLRIGREQLQPYGVEMILREVTDAAVAQDGFRVTLGDGRVLAARRLLLASGVVDRLPEFEGAAEMYGRSLFHCPYCDGWESRDMPLAAYGPGREAYGLALALKTWSQDVVLCTGGDARLAARDRARLRRLGISVREEAILRLEGDEGRLRRIVFAAGEPLDRGAMFFKTGQHQRSPLAQRLGCDFNSRGTVRTNRFEGSGVPGLYVAGDASEDVQLVVVAAAEGAKAGFAMNRSLQKEDLAIAERGRGEAAGGRRSRATRESETARGLRGQRDREPGSEKDPQNE
ncbi:MAG: NAD(P)/FAD-dependent oxidoreductase [Acidobacteriota bacterium]|nr:NAD(P)/FAD-dependent oxidoreductase [Acidobacteriota bacterium]